MNVAYADAFHRSLFGPIEGVNVHTSTRRAQGAGRVRPGRPRPRAPTADPSHGPAAQRTRQQLLEAGHKVFVERGYYATRVADIVKAAGVSHGVFYRYFDNKAGLFRILAKQAIEQLGRGARRACPSSPPRQRDRRGGRARAPGCADSPAPTPPRRRSSRCGARPSPATASSARCRPRSSTASRARLARHLEPRGLGRRRRRRHGAAHVPRRLHLAARHPGSHRPTFAQMIQRGLLTGPGRARRRQRARPSDPTRRPPPRRPRPRRRSSEGQVASSGGASAVTTGAAVTAKVTHVSDDGCTRDRSRPPRPSPTAPGSPSWPTSDPTGRPSCSPRVDGTEQTCVVARRSTVARTRSPRPSTPEASARATGWRSAWATRPS